MSGSLTPNQAVQVRCPERRGVCGSVFGLLHIYPFGVVEVDRRPKLPSTLLPSVGRRVYLFLQQQPAYWRIAC